MASESAPASASGKVILFGEHAVVYGRPAIAVPVATVRATAVVEPASCGSGLTLVAADLGRSFRLSTAPADEALAAAVRLLLDHLSASPPDAVLTVHSTIPIASGLGSGAAVSTAVMRALASFLDQTLTPAEIGDLVFEIEKIHHGTPSGIDNTVIAYEQPVYFVRGHPPARLTVGAPFTLLIADTGIPTSTKRVVARVRQAWQHEPARYEALFDQIGHIAEEARRAIETGQVDTLGPLMDENHELLIEVGVSSAKLDQLVGAARAAGALGAKLSGAGWGGNTIALVEEGTADEVSEALRDAGAAGLIRTRVER